MKFQFRTFLFLIFGLILFSCVKEIKDDPTIKTPKISVDLDQIQERGKLVAITGYNAYSYFIYKGQPMGYEYELLKRLAADLEVELEIKVIHELEEMIEALNNGGGDLIAFNLTVTKERTKAVSFTEHHTLTPQVLIQRKPLKGQSVSTAVTIRPIPVGAFIRETRVKEQFGFESTAPMTHGMGAILLSPTLYRVRNGII